MFEEAASPPRLLLPSMLKGGEGLRSPGAELDDGGGVGVTGFRMASGSAVTSTTVREGGSWIGEIGTPDVVLAPGFARVPIPWHGPEGSLAKNPTARRTRGLLALEDSVSWHAYYQRQPPQGKDA